VRKIVFTLLLFVTLASFAQNAEKPATLRSILLGQLHATDYKAEWFVTANTAVAGLTADQAKWTPGPGNHSVGQLTYHLWYWDARMLKQFKGEKLDAYDGNNN